MTNYVYKWMEECHVVQGYYRSCIYDLPREEFWLVDNKIQTLIKKIEGKKTNMISLSPIEKDWFNFLEEKEFIFTIPEKLFNNFRPIGKEWKSPNIIYSAIIDSECDLTAAILLLEKLKCKNIALTFKDDSKIEDILSTYFLTTDFRSISIYVENPKNEDSIFENLRDKFPIVTDIKKEADTEISNDKNMPLFVVNIGVFIESQYHNVYYNQKIFIDKNNQIKLYPKSNDIIGFTQEDIVVENLTKENFDLWRMNRNSTDVCSFCEYRHMCIDKRVPNYRKTDEKWFFHQECAYNPFICKWQGEEGYRSLTECGIISNENGFFINHARVLKINKELWAEE